MRERSAIRGKVRFFLFLICGVIDMEFVFYAFMAWLVWYAARGFLRFGRELRDIFNGPKAEAQGSDKDAKLRQEVGSDLMISSGYISAENYLKQRLGDDLRYPWEFKITFEAKDGKTITSRVKETWWHGADGDDITAICEATRSEIAISPAKISECINLDTGRKIKDLGVYLRKGYGRY